MNNSKITAWGHYLPEKIFTNSDLAKKIEDTCGLKINATSIELITGVKTRRHAEESANSSDLAVLAVEDLIRKNKVKINDVDLLIFAAASQDLLEPATSTIIQHKLGLDCPTFDVKNACNGFLNAFEIASGFIATGKYKKILIVNGEKPSAGMKYDLKDKQDYKTHFAALSFGDGGVAVLVEKTNEKNFLQHSKFVTRGKYWESGTLPGGGTMHPHDLEYTYFRGSAKKMVIGFLEVAPQIFKDFFVKSGKRLEDFDAVCVHQPTKEAFDLFIEKSKVNPDKVLKIFEEYGNVAAASIPLAISLNLESGRIKKGDNLLIIGLGGGITFGIQDIII